MSGCDECGLVDDRKLFANVDGRCFCVTCWKRAGRPFPKRSMTAVELANAEVATRERMLKRGGNQKYMARSGKA